jgi:serine/threonine protein kinase
VGESNANSALPDAWKAALEDFDAAWQRAPPPRIEAFLLAPEAGRAFDSRRSLLSELVKVDLEFRWRLVPADGGALPLRPKLEDYLAAFPALATQGELPLDLVGEEYRVRHCWGDRPGREEYVRRFGLQASQAAALFDPIDAELAAEGDPPVATPVPPEAAMLGSYLLLDRIGQGWSSFVYRARHTQMNRIVALKVIRKERIAELGSDLIHRFAHEMQAVGRLDHPNVIHVYDAGPIGATYFLAMEHIDGVDLDRRVKASGPLSIDVAVDYARQAAEGLQHVHAQGLVHRDFKPSNLLVSRRGGERTANTPNSGRAVTGETVKILDLGFALLRRSAGAKSGTMLTNAGDLIGSVDYLAPEQTLDPHRVDHRADLYSLGCTLYFLLTGQPPFAGGTVAQKLARHQHEAAAPLQTVRRDVPEALAALVHRLLAKQPDERFSTAAEAATALVAAARQPSRWRHWWACGAAALTIFVLAVCLVLANRHPVDKPVTVVPATVTKPPSDPKPALVVHCGRGNCLKQDEVVLPGYGYRLVSGACFDSWDPKICSPTYCWYAASFLEFEISLPAHTSGSLRLFMYDGFAPSQPPRKQNLFVQNRKIGLIRDFRTSGRMVVVPIRDAQTVQVRLEELVPGMNAVVSRIEFWPE